jgi:hypothetical protein
MDVCINSRVYVPAAGGGDVAFDAGDSSGVGTRVVSATSMAYTGITVGSGTNRALVFAIYFDANVSSVSAVWDSVGANQTMELIGSKKENTWNRYLYLFGLVAPASGNKTLSVSWTTTSTARGGAASFTGVNQSGGTASFADFTGADGSSATPAVSIPSASTDLAIAAHGSSDGAASARSHTSVFEGYSGDPPCMMQYADPGSATVDFTWTITSSTWGAAGCNLKAA